MGTAATPKALHVFFSPSPSGTTSPPQKKHTHTHTLSKQGSLTLNFELVVPGRGLGFQVRVGLGAASPQAPDLFVRKLISSAVRGCGVHSSKCCVFRISKLKPLSKPLVTFPRRTAKRHAQKATAAVNAAEALSKPSSLAACSGFRVEG